MQDDLEDPRPLYVRVADSLRAAIDRGEFPVGAKLPSYSELGSQFQVSHMTVKQAIATLKNEGTVVARQGMGVYVRSTTSGESRAPDLAGINSRLDQLEARIHAIENRVDLLGDR